MIKRLRPAAVAIALAALATSAAANPYFGYDGRHYGALAGAPDYGHAKGGGSRKGLTAPMLALLDRIESKFGPVNVISGYRPGARIAGYGPHLAPCERQCGRHRCGLEEGRDRQVADRQPPQRRHHDVLRHEPHSRRHRTALRLARGHTPEAAAADTRVSRRDRLPTLRASGAATTA